MNERNYVITGTILLILSLILVSFTMKYTETKQKKMELNYSFIIPDITDVEKISLYMELYPNGSYGTIFTNLSEYIENSKNSINVSIVTKNNTVIEPKKVKVNITTESVTKKKSISHGGGSSSSSNSNTPVSIPPPVSILYPVNLSTEIDMFQSNDTTNSNILICIHGGGWYGGDKKDCNNPVYGDITNGFLRNNYTVYALNYPLTKNGYGCNDIIESLNDSINLIRLSYNESNITIYGASAGGHLAQLIGIRRNDIKQVISVSGASNLSKLNESSGIGNLIPLFVNSSNIVSCSPITYANETNASFLFYHDFDDPTIPVAQSIEMNNVLLNYSVKSKIFTSYGYGHNLKPDIMEVVKEI